MDPDQPRDLSTRQSPEEIEINPNEPTSTPAASPLESDDQDERRRAIDEQWDAEYSEHEESNYGSDPNEDEAVQVLTRTEGYSVVETYKLPVRSEDPDVTSTFTKGRHRRQRTLSQDWSSIRSKKHKRDDSGICMTEPPTTMATQAPSFTLGLIPEEPLPHWKPGHAPLASSSRDTRTQDPSIATFCEDRQGRESVGNHGQVADTSSDSSECEEE